MPGGNFVQFTEFFGRLIYTHRRARPVRRSDACRNAGAMHAGTRRAVLSYWQLAVEAATRGQAMGTLRHISQESGS